MWRVLAIVATLSLGGCNTWTRYYFDALGARVQDVPELEPYYGNPVLVCTEDIEVGIERLRSVGFEPIGFSVFDDRGVVDVDGAVDQATRLSAIVILVYTRYPFAFCGEMVQREGSVVVSNFATAPVVSLDTLAPVAPLASSNGRASRGFGTKYKDYDYVAVYLARRRTLQGAVLSDLGDEDVYDLGARVDALVPRSPFDRAGLQLGDIIIFVEGVEMLDTWHVTKSVNEATGVSVAVRVLREGTWIDLTLVLPDDAVRKAR